MTALYRTLIGVLLAQALLFFECAIAETIPAKGDVDPRVRITAYNEYEVYKLKGVVGYQIDLEFEPGEIFTGLGAGDMEGLSFAGQENHLFLKPKATKVATNLTVLTNRRHYQFDYTALARAMDEGDVLYALRFKYPASPTQLTAEDAARRLDRQFDAAAIKRPRNVDYWYCGKTSIRPVEASDDGVHTRLKFPVTADLPAIFIRNEDDTESLLNFSMDAGDVVIHRIAKRFILRRGKLTGCIVNQGYSGGGVRLNSGTLSPDIERTVQGGVP
jgi:type IV secretion system protein VirB9